MMDVGYLGAFGAGILSFLSPCILPLVPPYLAFLGGVTLTAAEGIQAQDPGDEAGRKAWGVFFAALAFVFGFTVVFTIMGATASSLGQMLSNHLDTLAIVAGVVIIVFGLHFLGVFRVNLFYREARFQTATRPAGLVGAFVVGLAFAFGWTPCVGPVLASILFVAGSQGSAIEGASLLTTYSLGIGIPFLAAALAAKPFMRFMQRFRRHIPKVEKAMGGLLVVTGVLFVTGMFNELGWWLLETFPSLGRVG
ncbi:MAG: cytochrome c biogenesis protein CcdA [Rhodovibrio sp.]|nr:cytochrome c biogenesis protein CcdA [Rhodovibrio sp.]